MLRRYYSSDPTSLPNIGSLGRHPEGIQRRRKAPEIAPRSAKTARPSSLSECRSMTGNFRRAYPIVQVPSRYKFRLFACSPVRLFACSPVRLFACSPVRLFACSPPVAFAVRLSAAAPPVRPSPQERGSLSATPFFPLPGDGAGVGPHPAGSVMAYGQMMVTVAPPILVKLGPLVTLVPGGCDDRSAVADRPCRPLRCRSRWRPR